MIWLHSYVQNILEITRDYLKTCTGRNDVSRCLSPLTSLCPLFPHILLLWSVTLNLLRYITAPHEYDSVFDT